MPDRKTRSLEAALAEAKRQFTNRAYDDVSINDIAAAAQCSTTTIYDVYGNKKGLYDAAMQSQIIDMSRDIDAGTKGESALEQIVTNLENRIDILSRPQSREAIRSIIAIMGPDNIKAAPALRTRLVEQFFDFARTIRACMDQGDCREMEPDVVTDAIFAQTHWRPMLHGLLFGSNDPMNYDAKNLTCRILKPFLTPQGRSNYESLRPGITGDPVIPPKPPISWRFCFSIQGYWRSRHIDFDDALMNFDAGEI